MPRPVSAQYPISLGYRQRAEFDKTYIHRGVDFAVPIGTSVRATRGGRVVHAGRGGMGPAFGVHVVVKTTDDDGDTIWVIYAHLSATAVRPDQVVDAGTLVGRSGATGNVRGAHLHYGEFTVMQYEHDRRPEYLDDKTKAESQRLERVVYTGELLLDLPLYRVTRKGGLDFHTGPGKKYPVAAHYAQGETFIGSRSTLWYRRMAYAPHLWGRKTGLSLVRHTKKK